MTSPGEGREILADRGNAAPRSKGIPSDAETVAVLKAPAALASPTWVSTMAPGTAKLLSLVMVRDVPRGRLLLGWKKRGFGEGKLNGFGGKFDPNLDFDVHACAVRETREECGVEIAAPLVPVGRQIYRFATKPGSCLDVRVFELRITDANRAEIEAQVAESEEMRPAWVAEDAIPLHQMWADDRLWLEQWLRGAFAAEELPFEGEYLFEDHEGEGAERILEYHIRGSSGRVLSGDAPGPRHPRPQDEAEAGLKDCPQEKSLTPGTLRLQE